MTNERLYADTPRIIGEAFLRWNDVIRDLRAAVKDWPTDPVERARMLDGLDLNEIADAVDVAVAALRVLPGVPEGDDVDH